MANLGKIIYLSEVQKNELFALGSVTSNNTTITYNQNDLYITPDKSIDKIWLNGTAYTALNGAVDLGHVLTSADNELIAPVELSNATSQLYNIGDVFVHNDNLYRATSTIATSTTITPNSNCEKIQVIDLINEKAELPLIIQVSKENNNAVCDTNNNVIFEAVANHREIICLTDRASSFSTPDNNTSFYKLDSFFTSPTNNEITGVQFINIFITTINNASYFVKSHLTFQGVSNIQWADVFTLVPTKTSQLTNDSDFYVKPSTGIPSTDIASGVIPDIQINGTSIVSNGIATIPVRSNVNSSSTDLVTSAGISSAFSAAFGTTDDQIKGGTQTSRAIAPVNQHKAVFYGLAKAAGDTTQSSSDNAVGTYTSGAKTAIQAMLGVEPGVTLIETVSGTTPTITALPNVRYNCGEVSTISITPPANGTCDIFFTSGSTAAVLTVPSTVKWPAWFDATALETDMIYEIMITDGVYGSVMTWAS